MPQRYLPMLGELHNTNTVDKFKECDKKEMISVAGKKVYIACHITQILESDTETKHTVTVNVQKNTNAIHRNPMTVLWYSTPYGR